ncbi:MAG: hypothetical protein DRR00_27760 [Candidatus Parabeggiatoa sp. nov. 3]|nr:MAG: hypothetical protein DRR00_27760 [Gammaproteobacteria bacterium]RKZ63393.1 MAG: hypothetical protein DRQ99_17200 [Gammaproteobacteria bacterium]
MKNKRYPLSLLILLLLIASPLVFAIPPYMGVSVGKNLSFTNPSCLAAAQTVLSNNGFQKIVQYKTNTTLFAAYRNQNPYDHKAMIKCLSEEGVIIVVAVANVPKHAKAKAESLRQQVQQQAKIKKQVPVEEEIVFTEDENEPEMGTSMPPKAGYSLKMFPISRTSPKIIHQTTPKTTPKPIPKTTLKPISERSRDTLFSRNLCLTRAEVSMRDSGFYQGLGFDDDSVWGENDKQYKGTIRCLTAHSLVLFQVRGNYEQTREKGLNQLEKNF